MGFGLVSNTVFGRPTFYFLFSFSECISLLLLLLVLAVAKMYLDELNFIPGFLMYKDVFPLRYPGADVGQLYPPAVSI